VVDKPTFKGLVVPGGQVNMMFTARGFGKEDGACGCAGHGLCRCMCRGTAPAWQAPAVQALDCVIKQLAPRRVPCACCCCPLAVAARDRRAVPVDDSAFLDLMDGGEMMMESDDEE
jgi:hypothetical protein